MNEYLSIPNWDDIQHYKDRSPPWIKLHNKLLENYEFECLQDASKAHLICIWLLASRTNNKIKADAKWIARRICANEPVDVKALIDSGFLQLNQDGTECKHDASKVLQSSEQSACLEREREREREQSRERIEGEQSKDLSSAEANGVRVIFDYWCLVMNKNGSAKLTPKRKKCVTDRLKQGYSVEQIKLAIDGCARSDHHSGKNQSGTVYDDLELICRSGEKVEQFSKNMGADKKQAESDADAWAAGVETSHQGETFEHGQH